MQLDVIRPTAVVMAGTCTAVPSGTLASVSSDNLDSTYINNPNSPSGFTVRLEPHTLASSQYGRHAIRGRIRGRMDADSARILLSIGRTLFTYIESVDVPFDATISEQVTNWTSSADFFNLSSPAPIDNLLISSFILEILGAGTAQQAMEAYIDVDTRLLPQFTPQVRDGAGNNVSGGTLNTGNESIVWFGPASYDGLPPLDWTVRIANLANVEFFSSTGTGTPPNQIETAVELPDGSYNATFTVRSTIRGTDPFAQVIVVPFDVLNVVPPPSPPLLSVEREGEGYRLTWENPGGQVWDDDRVVTEIWRDDCTGSQRIATIDDGLNGSYLDLAIPQVDTEHQRVGDVCVLHETGCEITYRVRYWGYVSTTVSVPTTIPVQLIIGWSGTTALPSGWLRVTDYDGVYPRGATGTGTPSVTGGAQFHTHTAPSHSHLMPSHSHVLPGSTAGSGVSTNTERRNGASVSTVTQSHDHSLPFSSGASAGVFTGSVALVTDAVSNLPLTREVIWIRSDGSATAYPVGALAWSMESVSGWTKDNLSDSRFLRGAPPGGNGGSVNGQFSHNHDLPSHSHTSPNHDHPLLTSGLSGPAAENEASPGGENPRWLGRHTHPVNIVADNFGTIPNANGGTTTLAATEPPHRRLRVLRNTTGGSMTRIIGLYSGDIASLPSTLTLCNGSNGTPDMRGQFARDNGSASLGTTGGFATHNHTTPAHNHGTTSHAHAITIGPSENGSRGRDTTGSQGAVPTAAHTHTANPTTATIVQTGQGGVGITTNAANLPPFREAHFVRLDGTVAGGSLPTPELKVSEFGSITASAILHDDGMDRIGTTDDVMPVTATRQHGFPRLTAVTIPLDGGVNAVSTVPVGEDMSLELAVEGKAAIDRLEEILTAARVYWAPLGGTPGWYAPAGWSVEGPAPDIKTAKVTLVRQPWPSTPDPTEVL